MKTNIGQIFLTHPQDENFVSLYEEAFSKNNQTVELFVVLEIEDTGLSLARGAKPEYEKFAQTVVAALKRTYVSATVIDQDTFEKALAAINAALSRLAPKTKIKWYGKLNAVVAAVRSTGGKNPAESQLSLSTTGAAAVFLLRHQEFAALSESLSEDQPKPTKMFSNYSSGSLGPRDRVVLTTNQLFNYLSLERFREFLAEDHLAEACEETISVLEDVKTMGFATFVFDTFSPAAGPVAAGSRGKIGSVLPAFPEPDRQNSYAKALDMVKSVSLYFLELCWLAVKKAGAFIFDFFRRRPKKYLFLAIAILALLLIAQIGWASWNKTGKTTDEQKTSILSDVEKKLNEAEGALIYKDEDKVQNLVNEAKDLLDKISAKTGGEQRRKLAEQITSLKNKISREAKIDNPTVLTGFSGIPTDLVRSANGFLAFNRNSGSLAFYDFRTGTVKPLLVNQNASDLHLATMLGSSYVFLGKSGKTSRLNLAEDKLEDIGQITTETVNRPKALAALIQGASQRVYLLDANQNQIWRLSASDQQTGNPDKWLKTAAALTDARDMAIDGSIYVLYADRLDKFFNGQKTDFKLGITTPALKNSTRVFTGAAYQSIYILDPDNSRVLIFDKTGKLQKQIKSDKFRDLSDIYVDETTGIMHLLAGSELLQINYK